MAIFDTLAPDDVAYPYLIIRTTDFPSTEFTDTINYVVDVYDFNSTVYTALTIATRIQTILLHMERYTVDKTKLPKRVRREFEGKIPDPNKDMQHYHATFNIEVNRKEFA
jgi:hypothetical protein